MEMSMCGHTCGAKSTVCVGSGLEACPTYAIMLWITERRVNI